MKLFLNRFHDKFHQSLFFQGAPILLYRSRHQQRESLKHQNTFPSTCSDDIPRSTSEDSELHRHHHTSIPPPLVENFQMAANERLFGLQRSDSGKSLASQMSVESIHEYVKDKENQWKQKHRNTSTFKKIHRKQTLI